MNIKISFPAFVAATIFVVAAQPVMAQSDKKEERSTEKTYKRKYYTGKDADKYREMNDIRYPESRKARKHEGDEPTADVKHDHSGSQRANDDRNSERPAAREGREEERHTHDRDARPAAEEREESRPAEARHTHDRDARPTDADREEEHAHSHEGEGRDGRTYRRGDGGSRKENRRRAREAKWAR